jgi:hypothetical protein
MPRLRRTSPALGECLTIETAPGGRTDDDPAVAHRPGPD